MYFTFKLIVSLMALGGAFVFGVMLPYTSPTPLTRLQQVELSVASAHEYPETVVYRHVTEYARVDPLKTLGVQYVCGEVAQLGHFSQGSSGSYQRFIIKVIENAEGEHLVSLPILEWDESFVQPVQFEANWQRMCR